jgi:tetratricopeptide (TPR) repeat protein
MSLISDALKKVQRERDKLQGDRETPQPIKGSKLYSGKRLAIYGSLAVIIILAVVIVTIVFNPKKQPQMKALNIQKKQQQPVVEIKKQEKQERAQEQKVAAVEPSPLEKEKPSTTPPQQSKPVETPGKKELKKETPKPTPPPSRETKPVVSKKETIIKEKKPPAVIKKKKKPAGKTTKKTRTKPRQKIEKIKEPPQKRKITGKFSIKELTRQGDEFMSGKKYLQAVEKYKAALKAKKDPNLYLKLYTAFKAMNNSVLARAYIDDGIKHFPENFYLNKISTILYIRAKEYRKALASVKKALAKNPDDYTLYTYRGLCYYHHKDYPKAMEHFQKSLELNSDAVENYYYIGLIYDNRKQYQKALEYYNVFFKLNPDNKNFKHREWIIRRIRTLQKHLNQ